MNYVISDTHFGHANIIRYCNRPFRNAFVMDEALIRNINQVVRPSDTLWHLGDWSFGPLQFARSIRARIVCQDIRLITGNHDRRILQDVGRWSDLFTKIHGGVWWGVIEGIHVFMSHYPPDEEKAKVYYDEVKKNFPQVIYLHGHTHNNSHLDWHNVSVENIGYKPVSLKELYEHHRV